MAALRVGSYNSAKPEWRGVLREGSYPVYRCTHVHETQPEATMCAKQALADIKEWGEGADLPVGWIPYRVFNP